MRRVGVRLLGCSCYCFQPTILSFCPKDPFRFPEPTCMSFLTIFSFVHFWVKVSTFNPFYLLSFRLFIIYFSLRAFLLVFQRLWIVFEDYVLSGKLQGIHFFQSENILFKSSTVILVLPLWGRLTEVLRNRFFLSTLSHWLMNYRNKIWWLQ